MHKCCACNKDATTLVRDEVDKTAKFYCDSHAPDVWALVKKRFNNIQIKFLQWWNKQ